MNHSSVGWFRWSLPLFASGAMILCWDARVGLAAKPGELLELRLTDQQPVETLRLRYCPPGTIYPGRPNPDRRSSSLDRPPVSLNGFYIGETEVTLRQFRSVLGESGLTSAKTEASKFQGSNPQLLALIKTGKNEPVFFVGLPEAVQFCVNLQLKFDKELTEKSHLTIEKRQIRLPSHVEWQYAARAIIDANQQLQRPHFNRDVRFSDLNPSTREKCQEVWAKLGRSDPFVGSQEQLLVLTTVTSANEKTKVREVLTELHNKLIGGPARSSASGIGSAPWDHATQPSDLPNAWNLFDLHDNVTEWVIWASSIERRDELWNSMTSKVLAKQSLSGQPSVFLAGGFFSDSIQNLAHFTVWGGPKIPEGAGSPQDFEYQFDLVTEFSPGFRVVMERRIAEDWLFILRRGMFDGDQWNVAAEQLLDDSGKLLKELADDRHPGFRAVEFYRILHSSNQNDRQNAADFFQALAEKPVEAAKVPKPNLAALLGDSPTAKPSEPAAGSVEDDHQLFWKTFASLYSARSK